MTKKLWPDPDIESLIQRLNTTARADPRPAAPAGEAETVAVPTVKSSPSRWKLGTADDEARDRLTAFIEAARDLHASDLVLVAGAKPIVRIAGRLQSVGSSALDADVVASLCAAMVPPPLRAELTREGTTEFALVRPGVGRLRANVLRSRGSWAAALRLLPEEVPELGELQLPRSLERLAELEYGLVLVTGPTGSGKSTTLAALMQRILSIRPRHAITIENPVEYAHDHGEGVVEHIEVGRDAVSFPRALRAALRQDPDVLLIGEMRDPETIATAVTAGETGHLVLSTLHTGDGPQTIHRIVDSYPETQGEQVRMQLSVSLAAVVSQLLLPRADGSGRVPAVEVLVASPGVRNLIRQGKVAQIRSQISIEGGAGGMLSLDQSLARLVHTGQVELEVARRHARAPGEFDVLVRGAREPQR